MVTNLLIIPGDCCIGGVRHILSSFSVLGVINSPTRILSRLPSSTPLPNHRPHGNLQGSGAAHCFCSVRLGQIEAVNTTTQHRGRRPCCTESCSLVRVPCDLVADEHALHQPLCVEPCVVVTHLHRRELAQVLALREGDGVRERQRQT